MKTFRLLLPAVLVLIAASCLLPPAAWTAGPVRGPAGCTIEWDEPTTNTDSTPLTDLKEYRIWLAVTAGAFTGAPTVVVPAPKAAPGPGSVLTWSCAGLTDGQKWLTVRAVDLAGNESANAAVDPATGGSTANGLPFVYDGLKPGGAPGLRLRTP